MSNLKLVHIYTTPDKISAELIKTFLESYKIKTLIKANPGPEGAFIGAYGGHAPFNPWLVYVLENKEKEAKDLLKVFNKRQKNNQNLGRGKK
ncbi:MAG: hypothetical protein CO031_01685 [Candidatus Nealsonbacteria bacterium CG_4_9_14_0_2_um_filter_37_38]|nr:MAG: hypothetical protein COZ89_02855 [Candidatus Nealsonbacteria bacterium CG_4_8_14_3_um_filter_37_23]PJC51634.1 MAG: hypothetical protein CO031_01685 [Candidatus Nealsonbacteria bacterium CG_4_9_14_0_2_um_filter_37_38]